MSERTGFRFKPLFAFLISISMCFSQARQAPQRGAPARGRAPFLQQAKSYEDAPYITKVVFKNGMTVLVNEYRAQPIVSIQAYVDAGFSEEPPQNAGLASLVAAVVQRGPAGKATGTYRQSVQALGGFFRSSTGFEDTRFEIIAPSAQWKKALDLQADALLNPSFDPEGIALEAGLVLDGAHATLDDPSEFAAEKLLELAFNQPRLGKAGTLAGAPLRNYSRESLAGFHKAMYAPAGITLVVSGDVNASEVLNEVVRVYDRPAEPGAKRKRLPLEATQSGFRYRAIRGNISIPRLLFGFHTSSGRAEDHAALEVLSAILGLGKGSVLNSRLRDQRKLIFSEETQLTTYADFGFLSIQMTVDPQNIDQSEISALMEIELLKREEPSEADLERALAQLERSHWERLETVTGRAETLAYFKSLGDWKRLDRYISELRQVKPSDVKRVANTYLRLQNCSLLEYLPVSGEERNLAEESVRNTFEGLLRSSADQEQAARVKEVVLAVKYPANAGSFKFSEIRHPFQTASILRGPDMFIREDHTAPLIDMGIFFPGGKLAENKENAGITECMANLMLQGAGGSAQFHRQLEIYGGKVQPIVADDYFGFYFSILSGNFEAGFDLLREAIKTPTFDEAAIRRQKEIQTAEILGRRDSISYPEQLVNQALFKDFSYSLDSIGTGAGLAGIDAGSLQRWYDAYVRNRKPVVAAIGDTKGTSLASHFVRHFSGSRIQNVTISEEFVKPLENGEAIEGNWGKNQSMILFGFQAPPVDDEEEFAAAVLQSYVGDLGRFSQEIRDRLGAASRVSMYYEPRLRGGSVIVRAITNSGNEDAVLKSLSEEMQRVIAAPIAYRDFRPALTAAIGAYAIRHQERCIQIEDLAENVLAGNGLENYQNFVNGMQGVKEEDLKEVARRVFNMDKAVTVRMRGQSR
jgi:zinc protease